MSLGKDKALVALGIVSFFWGTTYLASRIGAQEIPGFFLSAVRLFVSGVVLVTWFLLKGYKIPDRETLLKLAKSGVFMLICGNGLQTWAMQYITSGLAAIIAALTPLLIVLFSFLMIKNTRITKILIAGLLIGLAGISTIFYDYFQEFLNPKFLFGTVLSLVATIMWAFGSVYSAGKNVKINLLYGAGLQMLIAGLIMLPVTLLTGKTVNLLHADTGALLALLYLIVFGSLITYSAYLYAMSNLPPSRVSVHAYINPILAVLLGWLILDEKLNIHVAIGTAITLVGVYMVNHEFKKQAAKKAEICPE
ncbi:MAG: EamA family transporter [Chitinophagales bacterium]|nr:EamA family transporter [Chitinophagales bacterium]